MTYDNVIHVVFLDLSRKVNINLNPVLRILFFNSVEERMEPFGAAEITDDPGEVDLWEWIS